MCHILTYIQFLYLIHEFSGVSSKVYVNAIRCVAETEKTHTHQRSLVLDYLFVVVVFFILISEKSHIVWYMHALHKFAAERKICR